VSGIVGTPKQQASPSRKWLEKCKDIDIVLFLGAGFSRHARLPTLADFGMASQDELHELSKHDSASTESPTNAAGMLRSAGATFRDFQKFCMSAQGLVNIQANNMEDIYCVAEMLNHAGIPSLRWRKRRLDVSHILKDIRLWLWRVYQKLPLVDRNALCEPYAKLVSELSLVRRPAIITTNYDIVFEYVAWQHHKPCAYPFQYEQLPLIKDAPSYLAAPEAERSMLMSKLHGSINYFDAPDGPSDQPVVVADGVLTRGKKVGESSWEDSKKDRPAILAVDSVWKIATEKPDLQPAIVPPTYEKLRRGQWLRDSWNAAVQAVRYSKGVIFIGYGMPDTDGFMRALLQAALASREKSEAPQVYVVDPSDHAISRYARLFRGSSVRHVPFSFEEAMANGEMARAIENIWQAL
jgi:hypothetical protein